MKAHHFPVGLDHVNNYYRLADDELEALAYAGDVIAKKELGSRLILQRGLREEGVAWLKDAAADGSHYALNELSVLGLGSHPNYEKNLIESLAWKKVSYMLGDWQALWSSGLYQELTEVDNYMTDLVALSYYEELNRAHLQRYGTPIERSAMPGYVEFSEQLAAARLDADASAQPENEGNP